MKTANALVSLSVAQPPPRLAATFGFAINAANIEVPANRNDAIAQNDSRTAQVETWKIRGPGSRCVPVRP